jgi:hypothetical protein
MNQGTADHRTQLTGHALNFSDLLPPTPHGARQARQLAVRQLRGWGLPLDPAEHLVAELAANPAPDSESGRGLVIVEALADRWGVELGPRPRKTVWAECGVG